ncbi:hypothetical protein FQN57_003132 [Myotisia sp. PD_48]|nr:hypothetical protein FQN57_003132 [Myotisia sp. PD_48]
MENPSESRNPRRPPEETGPFGKRRNTRYASTRSATRTGTPAKRENQNVAEFGRLFNLQQEEEAQRKLLPSTSATSSSVDGTTRTAADQVATECILYGYRDKGSEWKVIDKFERISQGYICEDYLRTDPEMPSKYPQVLSGGDVVIRPIPSADANRKSKRYAGGSHWIKVTFDSSISADRACAFSPQQIDGYFVFCEVYNGHGPQRDAPLTRDCPEAAPFLHKFHTLNPSSAFNLPQPDDFDRATLPRSFVVNSSQGERRNLFDIDTTASVHSTVTASSATVLGRTGSDTLRHRQPNSQAQDESKPLPSQSEYMTHIPSVRRAVLRPASEALPPQPSVTERVIRSIPVLSWFTGDIVGDGPVLREDGSFDDEKSNLYWRFWYAIDQLLGTDLCGLKEES